MTDPEASVTQWIDALRGQKDEVAAKELWQRYFQQLVDRMRPRIAGAFRRMSDEEDVALSALDALFRGLEEDRFPELSDRESLWSLLLTLAERRAQRHYRRETTQKRGSGRVVHEDTANPANADSIQSPLQQFASQGPAPEFLVMIQDELSHQLDELGDPVLRQLLLLELEGHNPEEIRRKLGFGTVRTVFRKKKLIQTMWREILGTGESGE